MVFSKKLVARYRELKHKAADCILLMQVGAFMQVMDEDARAVSSVTGLKLQMASFASQIEQIYPSVSNAPSFAITYIYVAFDFFQKNLRLRLAVVTWMFENLLFLGLHLIILKSYRGAGKDRYL